jgi:hypothetical protein
MDDGLPETQNSRSVRFARYVPALEAEDKTGPNNRETFKESGQSRWALSKSGAWILIGRRCGAVARGGGTMARLHTL